MIVSIGDIVAHCPGCGAAEFDALPHEALRKDSVLRCSGCGRETAYVDLLEQIGQRAMDRANEAWTRLKGEKE